MHLDAYAEFTDETAIYNHSVNEVLADHEGYPDTLARWMRLAYVAGKLNGEAGELGELVFKALRDDRCELTEERRTAIRKELGDVLWYVARIARELDMSLDDIAIQNMSKLISRKERGKLGGSGNDR